MKYAQAEDAITQPQECEKIDRDDASGHKPDEGGYASSNAKRWADTTRRFSMLYQHNFQSRMQRYGDKQAQHTEWHSKSEQTTKRKRDAGLNTVEASGNKEGKGRDPFPNAEHWDNTQRRFSMLYQHNLESRMRRARDEQAQHRDQQDKAISTIKHKPVPIKQQAEKRQKREGHVRVRTQDRCNRCCW